MDEDNSTIISEEDIDPYFNIMFILLTIIEIPSILCTIFILIFFFINWNSMMIKPMHNHAIFILIIISFIYTILDQPFLISSFHLLYDRFHSRSFCLWWAWIDYSTQEVSVLITGIASIQRHILVFHSRLLHGSRKRWILHYIPLIFAVFYPTIFSGILIFIYPCEYIYIEDYPVCSSPCYRYEIVLSQIDWALNFVSPIIILIIANIALVSRVIYSMDKFRRPQTRAWKKRRKLILQLLSIALLYIIGWGPGTILSIVEALFLPTIFIDIPGLSYLSSLSYFICPLQPFICIFALPELLNFIKSKLKRRGAVINATISVLHTTNR